MTNSRQLENILEQLIRIADTLEKLVEPIVKEKSVPQELPHGVSIEATFEPLASRHFGKSDEWMKKCGMHQGNYTSYGLNSLCTVCNKIAMGGCLLPCREGII